MKTSFISPTYIALLILALASLLSGCAAPAQQAAPATATKTNRSTEGAVSWQEEWEQLARDARKEGNVTLYAMFTAPTRTALIQVFKQTYGIDLDVTIGRATEIPERALRENRAGLNLADVVIAGRSTALTTLNPAGLLTSLEPLLLLPEVKDPEVWWQKKLPYLEDNTTLAFNAYVQTPMVVNTDMVKQGELSSMKDLLNPRWKGKITINDPTVGGQGLSWFSVFSELLGYDFMRALAKMDPAFTADRRLHVEWVAKGKYPVGLAPMDAELAEFIKAGAPLGAIIPEEGSYLSHGAGVVSFFAKAPHPNAAKLFINWLLSREGQVIYSRAEGTQTSRVDVPTDHLAHIKVRQPGIKYVLDNPSLQPEKQKMVREIFGPLLK
ncbi:MAG: extracellular solute-binding protein [Chloroflexi bacterium]|nr:extracellular solute-binding protein [Chloroflexota bacterium]